MFEIVFTNKMKRDVRLMKKRGKDMDKLEAALLILAEGKALPAKTGIIN